MAVWADLVSGPSERGPFTTTTPPPHLWLRSISLIVHLCTGVCAARWGSHRTVVFAQSLELPVDPWRPGDSPMFRWRKPGPRKVKQLAMGCTPQKQQQTWLLLPVSVMDTPVFSMYGQKAPPAFPDLRGSLQRRSDGGSCPVFMCSIWGLGGWCTVVWCVVFSALPCAAAKPSSLLPLPAVHGLLSCLSRSGHSLCVFLAIRGTRQLKASGNLGFMDVSQRPG